MQFLVAGSHEMDCSAASADDEADDQMDCSAAPADDEADGHQIACVAAPPQSQIWSNPIAFGNDYWLQVEKALGRSAKEHDVIKTAAGDQLTIDALVNSVDVGIFFPIQVRLTRREVQIVTEADCAASDEAAGDGVGVGSTCIECNDVLGSKSAGVCCSKDSNGPSGSPCFSETLSYRDRSCAVIGRCHLSKVNGMATSGSPTEAIQKDGSAANASPDSAQGLTMYQRDFLQKAPLGSRLNIASDFSPALGAVLKQVQHVCVPPVAGLSRKWR